MKKAIRNIGFDVALVVVSLATAVAYAAVSVLAHFEDEEENE